MKNLLIVVIAVASIQSVASLYCKKTSTNWLGYTSSTYIYCSSGYKCCGTYSTRYCCYDYSYSYNPVTYGIGPIIGGVVGTITFIIVVIVVIVCICKHKNRSRGVVVQAPLPSHPHVFMTSHNSQQPTNSSYPSSYPSAYPPAYPPTHPHAYPPAHPPANPPSDPSPPGKVN